jgi:TonB-dependent siderophore receptor
LIIKKRKTLPLFLLPLAALCQQQVGFAADAAVSAKQAKPSQENTDEISGKDRIKILEQVYVTGTTVDTYSSSDTKSATKMIMSLRETPQSVAVITQQQLEDWQAVNINDALKQATGVFTSYGSSQDRPTFIVRGDSVNLIQIDGVQQFPGGRRPNVNGDSIAYERIEVIRGANGLLTGVGDPTATINLVRKRASNPEFAGHIGVMAGRWNNQRIEADISTPLDSEAKVRARVAAAYYDRDSFIDRYGQEKTSIYATIEGDITENTLLRAGVEYADTESRGAVNTNATPYYFADGSRTYFSRGRTGMTAKHSGWPLEEQTYFVGLDQFWDNGWHLNAIATYNTIDMQGGQLFFIYPRDNYLNPDGSAEFAYSTNIGSSKDIQKTLDISVQGPVDLFGRTHEVIVGYNSFDRSRVSYGNVANQSTISLADLNYFTWTGDVPRYPYRDTFRIADGITEAGGFFAATRVNLADPLKLILGARLTDWQTMTRQYNRNTGAYTETNGAFEVEDEITPYAGVVFDVSRNLSVYASYTDAFQPQNYYDANDNPLGASIGESREVGIKGELFDDKLNFSAAYFQSEMDNVAEDDERFADNVLTDKGNDPHIAISGNKASGYELEMSGEIYDGWSISAGYADVKSRTADGNPLNENMPDRLLTLYTTYHFFDKWTLGVGANWQSSYEVRSFRPQGRNGEGEIVARPERRTQGSLTLFSAMARYELSDAWSITANVSNLFDKEYYNSISDFDGSVTWGEPRNWKLSTRYSW